MRIPTRLEGPSREAFTKEVQVLTRAVQRAAGSRAKFCPIRQTIELIMRQNSSFLRPIRSDLAAEFHSALGEYTNLVQRHVNQRPELARALAADALKRRASDIHLEPRALETRIRFRID